VLVANRGEIAVRVIRALHELGVEAVAVYSTADRDALHVRLADHAVCVGPPSATESYLRIPSIVAAAMTNGCEAVHPGYGFLSENAAFALACADNDVVFVGPTAESMEELGDKADGIYFVSAKFAGDPTAYEDGLLKTESEQFVAAMKQYAPDVTVSNFTAQMFQDTLLLWHVLYNAAAKVGADKLDHDAIVNALGSTVNHHEWAASPVSCGKSVEGYKSICNTLNSVTQWDAASKTHKPVADKVDGAYIIAGTKLDPSVGG